MKNALLITGVFVGAVSAAVLAWAVFGGTGGGRNAILEEPTEAGSIGELTIQGVAGGTAMPVTSFSWRGTVVSNNITQSGPLEVLRGGGDEDSPAILAWVGGNTQAPTAVLDLKIPDGIGRPYLTYELTNTRGFAYHGGKHEQFALHTLSGLNVRTGRGALPQAGRSEVIGFMTLPGEERVPIVGFEAGFTGGHKDLAVIRRPLDHLVPTLKAAFVGRTFLGVVTIELQKPDESRPHVTYQLEGNVAIQSITDSAAVGRTPTEEIAVAHRQMRVSQGGNTFCYDGQFNNC